LLHLTLIKTKTQTHEKDYFFTYNCDFTLRFFLNENNFRS